MYEAYTFEFLMDRALKNAKKNDPNIDTREGGILYNAIAPSILELAIAHTHLDIILNESFADTATREYLIKRCSERGIVPKPATKAIRQGEFNVDVPLSTRFSLNVLNYKVIKQIASGVYQLECETAGIVGNIESGKLIPIDYVEGLKTAELTEILIAGEDAEDTETLRERYFNSLNSKAFGGNVADYKEKTKSINGVGGVKVHPAWNGGGTVKLVIIDTENNIPSQILINSVQNEIDPIEFTGQGQGTAPIGHKVTVEAVQGESVNISTNIIFKDGWNWENSQVYLNECIDNYFKQLSNKWENETNLVVRISQIESQLLTVEGVLDVYDTLLNGLDENYIVSENAIPVRGDITSV